MNKGFVKLSLLIGGLILAIVLAFGVSKTFAKVQTTFAITDITANCNGSGQVTYTGTIPQGGFTLELKDKAGDNSGPFISTVPPTIITITSGASPVSYNMPLDNWNPPHYRVDSNHNTKSPSLNCEGVTPTPTITPTVTPTPTINPCEDDKDWKECVTPTPTVTPSPTPPPCVVWEGEFPIPCPTETPTPTPTVTPTVTPTPEQTSSSGGIGGGSVSAPVCSDGNTVKLPANPFVVRKGSDATVNFFITQGDSANIYYRVVGHSDWQYSVLDLKPNGDNFVSYTIHGLDANLGYDFGIQQKFGCGGGQLVTAVIVDGPQARTFTFSYWEWSK